MDLIQPIPISIVICLFEKIETEPNPSLGPDEVHSLAIFHLNF